jgi:hypothetical protein
MERRLETVDFGHADPDVEQSCSSNTGIGAEEVVIRRTDRNGSQRLATARNTILALLFRVP